MSGAPRPRAVTVTLNPAVDLHEEVAAPRLNALNRAHRAQFEPSGKGVNVARALHEQGVPVTAVAPLGGLFGTFIREALEAEGLDLRACPVAGDTRLNLKVADPGGGTTEFNLPGPALSPEELRAVWEALRAETGPGGDVVLAGSLPPGAPARLYADWTREVQAGGARVWLDTSGEALRAALPARPFLVKPNREEAGALLGASLASESEVLDAAGRLRRLGARNVVLSLGAQGALFLGEEVVWVSPPPLDARRTAGCGDALLAGLLAALTRGETWREAARWATATAAARAGHRGPTFGDVGRARELLPHVRLEVVEAT